MYIYIYIYLFIYLFIHIYIMNIFIYLHIYMNVYIYRERERERGMLYTVSQISSERVPDPLCEVTGNKRESLETGLGRNGQHAERDNMLNATERDTVQHERDNMLNLQRGFPLCLACIQNNLLQHTAAGFPSCLACFPLLMSKKIVMAAAGLM